MDSKESVMDKVQKLLAKANGTDNQAEAEAFFAKAAQLMTQHGIEQHELKSAEEKAAGPKVEEVSMEGAWSTERPSHLYVRQILRACFNVTVLKYKKWGADGGKVNTYTVIGERADCEFAIYAFMSLEHTFNRLWRARLRQFGAERLPRSERNGYFDGLRLGFIHAWRKAREAEMQRMNAQSYAIVLVDKDKAVDAFLSTMRVRNVAVRRKLDHGAREDGFRDGQHIRVNRPLGGGDNKAALRG